MSFDEGQDRKMAIFTTLSRELIEQDEKLVLSELGDRELFALFTDRKAKYALQNTIKNYDLWAGAPMFFYCEFCKFNHAILPEDYLEPPDKYCRVCTEMKERGLL